MALDWSSELACVVDESRDIAAQLGHDLTSAHLLLCFFAVENQASDFLTDHEVTVDRLMTHLQRQPREGLGVWNSVMERAGETALISGAPLVTSLHVLVSLCSSVDSQAYKLIAALDLDMSTVRSRAYAQLTHADAFVAEPNGAAEPVNSDALEIEPIPRWVQTPAAPVAQRAQAAVRAALDEEDDEPGRKSASGLREPDDVRRQRRRRAPAQRRPIPARRDDTTRDLARRLHESGGNRRAVVSPSNLPLPPSVRRAGSTSGEAKAVETPKPGRTLQRRDLQLREREFPTLNRLGRNLSLRAFDGALDDVVGRDAEIDQLVDILNKRRSNNPVLVGEAGVGKTAVVEGLARRMVGAGGADVPPGLAGRILVELEASKIVSGTGLRGSFSQRIQDLKAEVARANGRVVLFLDELHHWIGMGSGDGNADGAGELKTALARGEFPCIGATTFDEYAKFVETDPAFARRFQKVRVEEPTTAQAVSILRGVQPTYERHHEVTFDQEAVDAAVHLTHRYLPDRRLPDKAIGVLDLAGSRARRTTGNVDRALVATVVAELAGLSADKLLLNDRQRFNDLGARLGEHIVGHGDVRERVAHALRRNYAGFVSGRPIGTFLFLGPTGVGKTEFAKAIARVLFDDRDAMVRFDMTEFMEAHSVARLIGAPPGYLGHDAGGQLTEAIRRRPYQLVLFDEIEKAHTDVLNLLIQLLDEGRLTDSKGRTVDFSNTVIVLTSNLGADAAFAAPAARRVGFGISEAAPTDDSREDDVLHAARGHFRPELWNRIQERLVFLPLSEDEVRRIAELQLGDSRQRLLAERRIGFEWDESVIELLIHAGGYDPEMGARPMRRTIERVVESAIADRILAGEVDAGDTLRLYVADHVLKVERA